MLDSDRENGNYQKRCYCLTFIALLSCIDMFQSSFHQSARIDKNKQSCLLTASNRCTDSDMICWRMNFQRRKLLKRQGRGKKVKLSLDKNAYIDEYNRKCIDKCKLTEDQANQSKIVLTLSMLLQAIVGLGLVTNDQFHLFGLSNPLYQIKETTLHTLLLIASISSLLLYYLGIIASSGLNE